MEIVFFFAGSRLKLSRPPKKANSKINGGMQVNSCRKLARLIGEKCEPLAFFYSLIFSGKTYNGFICDDNLVSFLCLLVIACSIFRLH